MFMSLSGIYELGGPVGATLDVIIVRSYPILYMEMTTCGQKIIRTEKEELKVALAFEEKRAALVQSLLGRRRQNEEYTKRSSLVDLSVKTLDASCVDGELLYNSIINTNAEPADAQNMLSDDQREALERYVMLKQDEDQAAVDEAVEKTMPSRQVHALFKLALCDYPAHTYKSVETNASRMAVVTMWRPQNMTPSDFKEGSRFLMSGLTRVD
ncbi:Breast cancer 2, early onset [Coemansia sp. RSA 2559]|nr:Breast cancer 2, early onset [Coemansia sp. RSA 2559]